MKAFTLARRRGAPGPYEKDAWRDEEALDPTDSGIIGAGPYRFGRLAAQTFSPGGPERAMAVIDQSADEGILRRLASGMGGQLTVDRTRVAKP